MAHWQGQAQEDVSGCLPGLRNNFHIWLCVGAWPFLWPRQPSGFQLPKTMFTILRLSYKDKHNVYEEGWLPVSAALRNKAWGNKDQLETRVPAAISVSAGSGSRVR